MVNATIAALDGVEAATPGAVYTAFSDEELRGSAAILRPRTAR
jgi:hypothetical protein